MVARRLPKLPGNAAAETFHGPAPKKLQIPQKSDRSIASIWVCSTAAGRYSATVQRLFSMFPQGGPGLALLLLRISVAATFVLEAVHRSGASPSHMLFAAILLISISTTIGFMTPLLSFVVGVSAAVCLVIDRQMDLTLVSLIVNSTMLALLGPGAYSLDARIFGRRVVVVPPRKDVDQI